MKVKAKFDRLTVSDPKVKARGQSTLVSGFCHPGISFWALNRSHHFLLKKKSEFNMTS